MADFMGRCVGGPLDGQKWKNDRPYLQCARALEAKFRFEFAEAPPSMEDTRAEIFEYEWNFELRRWDFKEPRKPKPTMQPIEQAFLQDIIAHPSDDTQRLIYADWLDDHDQAERAEFIRLQIKIAQLDKQTRPPTMEARRLCSREGKLLKTNFGAWTYGLPEAIITQECRACEYALPDPETSAIECRDCEGSGVIEDRENVWFYRGFVSDITLSAADWITHADAITRSHPIEKVKLTTWPTVTADRRERVYYLEGRRKARIDGREIAANRWSLEQTARKLVSLEWPAITFEFPS